jgi:hypothetical protein
VAVDSAASPQCVWQVGLYPSPHSLLLYQPQC